MKKALLIVGFLVLTALPAQAHGTNQVTADKPYQLGGNAIGTMHIGGQSHPNYLKYVWLQSRPGAGGSWVTVAFQSCYSATLYCNTANAVAFNCNKDYQSLAEGWAESAEGVLHNHTIDLTSPILQSTC